jgi:5,6-dimethylbenzimidazole synthase
MREPTTFDEVFRTQLQELFVWRRDVRRFQTTPLPAGTLERLIDVACLAPSVGLSQPWRFVIVDDEGRRASVVNEFKSCNAEALQSYSGERAAHYAKLKLAGLSEAPSQLAVFADRATDVGHGLGRRTMPEMIEYSDVPAEWHFIGYFCLGYPQSQSSQPELECAGWESRRPSQDCVLRR